MEQRMSDQLIELEDQLTQLESAVITIQQSKEISLEVIQALKQAQSDYSDKLKATLKLYEAYSTELLEKNDESLRSIDNMLLSIKNLDLMEHLAGIRTIEAEMLQHIASSSQVQSAKIDNIQDTVNKSMHDLQATIANRLNEHQESMPTKKELNDIRKYLFMSIGICAVAAFFSLIGIFF